MDTRPVLSEKSVYPVNERANYMEVAEERQTKDPARISLPNSNLPDSPCSFPAYFCPESPIIPKSFEITVAVKKRVSNLPFLPISTIKRMNNTSNGQGIQMHLTG
ncbi:hypothetical protein [Desulfoluna butyratoxydans]|uniref:hypothetical protein n=1 Tax=Desulfoluna butyratoxydans TaxID=231438 RepID=UPI0015D40C9F|nr:hypothetical protein [Desulfoluna butyratoxydans]